MNRRQFLVVGATSTLASGVKAEATGVKPNSFAERLNAAKVVPANCSGPHIETKSPSSWALGADCKIHWTYFGFELADKDLSPDTKVIKVGDPFWMDRWSKELSRVTTIVMERNKIRLGDVRIENGKLIYQLWAVGTGGARWDFDAKRWI